MAIIGFPPIESADEYGLLAIGGDLEPESLYLAYSSGIFPWPIDGKTLTWFSPPVRAVLFIGRFHTSESTIRAIKKSEFTAQINTAFKDVIDRCAEVVNRGDQNGTWITPQIKAAYIRLHELGMAHSFETYLHGELVGGIYGVQFGRFFAAESSFYRRSNASKLAMITMAEYLRLQGIAWFDCQELTPFSESFGAEEISRDEYMQLLKESFSET